MKIFRTIQSAGFISIIFFSLIALAACAPSSVNESSDNPDLAVAGDVVNESTSLLEVDITTVDEDGSTAIDSESLEEAIAQVPSGELSQQEMDGLLFMREEEKLAQFFKTSLKVSKPIQMRFLH